MPDKKIKSCHPEEHNQRIHSSILRKINMIGHENQRKGTGGCDIRGELP
jgi:hypothetical protein